MLSGNPLGRWLEATDDEDEPQGPEGRADASGEGLWDDDPWDDEPRTPRRRIWLVLTLAVVPWLVVATLLLGDLLAPSPTPPAATVAASTPAATAASVSPTAAVVASPAPVSRATPAGAPLDAAGVTAALAVRSALTFQTEGQARYVDLALPVHAETLADHTVVRVAAVVLEGGDDGWTSTRTAYYAVPVTVVDGQPIAVDAPWPVPSPEAAGTGDAAEDAWSPDPAPPAALRDALAAAGYRDVTGMQVERHAQGALLRAHFRGQAPGEGDARAHTVWLLDGDPPQVAGVGG